MRALQFLGFATILLVHAACGAKPDGPAFLWRIERNPPAWLFGTIHLSDPRVTSLHTLVGERLDQSDIVIGELDLTDEEKSAQQSRMLLSEGQTLRDVLDADVFAALADFVQRRGHAMAVIERMKPWVAAMSLLFLDGIDPAHIAEPALDDAILQRARAAGKEVSGIETIDEQLSVFEDLNPTEQNKLVAGTVKLLDQMAAEGRQYITMMIDAYLTGDAAVILRLADETTGFEDEPELQAKFMKVILTDRNVRMAERVDARLKKEPGKSFFFAFGTLHMPGEEGLVALLREKGYEVTRLAAPKN